jgi:hypothetical protein
MSIVTIDLLGETDDMFVVYEAPAKDNKSEADRPLVVTEDDLAVVVTTVN